MTARRSSWPWWPLVVLVALIALALWRLPDRDRSRSDAVITIYSGRNADLIQPLIDRFEAETGIRVRARFGQTAEMAATILEEGRNSPADIFFGQDAGALGALARAERFQPLPQDVLGMVPPRFRSPNGLWVGTSGRARILVYNTDRLNADALPQTLDELTGPEWTRRVAWAPQNGSFQAFITALRVQQGDEATRQWLEAMHRNDARAYAANTPILLAVATGEIDIGLTNHYYLHAMQAQGSALHLKNHYPDEGVLINVAGVGLLNTFRQREAALTFIRFLLSEEAQRYFTEQTFEYPLIDGIALHPDLPPLDTLATPDLDLSDLDDLVGTLRLLESAGVL